MTVALGIQYGDVGDPPLSLVAPVRQPKEIRRQDNRPYPRSPTTLQNLTPTTTRSTTTTEVDRNHCFSLETLPKSQGVRRLRDCRVARRCRLPLRQPLPDRIVSHKKPVPDCSSRQPYNVKFRKATGHLRFRATYLAEGTANSYPVVASSVADSRELRRPEEHSVRSSTLLGLAPSVMLDGPNASSSAFRVNQRYS